MLNTGNGKKILKSIGMTPEQVKAQLGGVTGELFEKKKSIPFPANRNVPTPTAGKKSRTI